MKKYFAVTALAVLASSMAFAQGAPAQQGGQTDGLKFHEVQKHILETINRHKVCVEKSTTFDDLERCRPSPPRPGANQEKANGSQGSMR